MVIAGADLAEAERASDRERFRLFGLSAVAQLSGIILTPAVRSIVSRHAAGKAVAAADLDERQCGCRAREVWCAGSLLGHVTTADDRNQEGSGTDMHLHECSRSHGIHGNPPLWTTANHSRIEALLHGQVRVKWNLELWTATPPIGLSEGNALENA